MTVLSAPTPVRAQQPATPAFTLTAALQYAAEHYPTVRAAVARVEAASADIEAARAVYLPRLDSVWQTNRGTTNNVFGQLLPQTIIPSLSGPVLPASSAASVWGNAGGALLSWEAVDFGRRAATVSSAEAAVTGARASEALTRLEVQRAVGRAFLDAAAAARTVAAMLADVDRRDTLARSVHALVDNQLRPGVEASRADAELAAARTRLIRAQAALTAAQAHLARLLGLTTGTVTISADGLVERLPSGDTTIAATEAAHPLARVAQAAVDAARAEQEVLSRSDLPRLLVESSVYARGSGARPDATFSGGAFDVDRANWAAGLQIVFPNVFDFSNLRARKAAAAATERADAALYDEALLTVATERQAATAMLQAARAIVANTPVQLAAARQGELQARTRYQAGLTNIIEVSDAQSLLAQAENDDELARIDVWRALLDDAAASGDLAPLLRAAAP